MPETKIGLNQVEKPAPLWYRRLANALIMFIIPGTTTLISSWGLSDKTLARALLLLSYAPAVIKGLGMILGNGQIYSPSNAVVDNQTSKN